MVLHNNTQTSAQLMALVAEVTKNPHLGDRALANDEQWSQLAEKLNALPGPNKSVVQWKAVLKEWQEVVCKVLQNFNNANGAGSSGDDLGDENMKLLEELLFSDEQDNVPDSTTGLNDLFKTMGMDQQKISKVKSRISFIHKKTKECSCEGVEMLPQIMDVEYEGTMSSLAQGMTVNVTDEGTEFVSHSKKLVILQRGNGQGIEGKKFKIFFDGENAEDLRLYGGPQADRQINALREVTKDLERHISSIQDRMHVIEEMWHHRCEDV